MLRGYTTFKCNDCNKTFRGIDLEYKATVYSVPMSCPHCNSRHTYTPSWHILGFYPLGNNREIYKRIWQKMDKVVSQQRSQQIDKPENLHVLLERVFVRFMDSDYK